MVRGRKKDLTIPPSRALEKQRDYRARKAQYLYELQQRCARAEEENVRLRRELEIARAASSVPSPEVATIFRLKMLASRDLTQHLANLSASIFRFQRVTQSQTFSPHPLCEPSLPLPREYSNTRLSTSVSQPQLSPSTLRPTFFHSPASPPSHPPNHPPIGPTLVGPETRVLPSLQKLDHPQSHSRLLEAQHNARSTPARSTPDTCPSPSSSSECCGGYIDCTLLVEEEGCDT
ncbi:hypothetical protein BU15DRAFT_63074 [Melanogaster broomeanus]|nr:hypothetical protein BU15DRAFT_63074 [Melanogaster broomeanus]